MGRETVSYRGQLLTFHGGDLPGFHSQVSFLPKDKLGVIVFVIGDHCASLYNTVSYNVYERLLGLDQTPWSERLLDRRLKSKKAGTEARAKAGADRVPNTKPSHALADYAGEYEHPAYGVLKVELKDGALQIGLPQDPPAPGPLPLRPLRHARRRDLRPDGHQLPDQSPGRHRQGGRLAGRSRGDVHPQARDAIAGNAGPAGRELRAAERRQVPGHPQRGRRTLSWPSPATPSRNSCPTRASCSGSSSSPT